MEVRGQDLRVELDLDSEHSKLFQDVDCEQFHHVWKGDVSRRQIFSLSLFSGAPATDHGWSPTSGQLRDSPANNFEPPGASALP